MVDFPTAREKMCEHFETHWQANAAGLIEYTPEIRFPRVVYKDAINPALHWGRMSLQTVMSNQAAFCGYENGKKKYEESGIVIIQLFAPKDRVEAAEEQDKFAQIARAAFRGRNAPGKVWFRRARINDIPDEKEMLRLNVVAEYEYNEIA